ncbi:hypothetical protein PG993_012690 [Apiospora rasikravindrae]|uniref:Uncharacterized protein n=1 Tax=Apiospora rasikravindrae TaxID=990691 RepID=A0ABR1S353_9PEZI
MSDLEESDLFAINLADDDHDPEAGASATATDPTTHQSSSAPPADRTGQTEDEFQAVRRGYRVKVENGDIWKTIELPLGPSPKKNETQELLHAVEELYFFRRFEEGAAFARRALGEEQEATSEATLDAGTRRLLKHYESRCRERSAAANNAC